MDATQNAAFREYEELKVTVRKAEKRMKELQPSIIPLVPEGTEIQGAEGYFYVQPKARWQYSESLRKDEDALKKRKEKEQAQGVAKATFSPVLYYRGNEEE